MFHHILLWPLHVKMHKQGVFCLTCSDPKRPSIQYIGCPWEPLLTCAGLECCYTRLIRARPSNPIGQYISRPYSLPYISMEPPTLHCRPYHTIPYHTIPYRTVPYHIMPYHTIPYHIMLYYDIPYCTTMSYGELSKSI